MLTYDPKSGYFYRNGIRAGGSDFTKGYRRIMWNGKRYKEHILAWYFYYGVWPENQIDHRNGNKADNSIANLRDVSQTVNMYNKLLPHKNNGTRFLGVSASGSKFFARIKVGKKLVYLGTYSTPEEAQQHYFDFRGLLCDMD